MTEQLAAALKDWLATQEKISPKTLADFLLKSGLVSETRAAQYCALREFYEKYGTEKKYHLISNMAIKYNVSERTLKYLTTTVRRFQF